MNRVALLLVSSCIMTSCSIDLPKCSEEDSVKLASAGFTEVEIGDICNSEENYNINNMVNYEGVYLKVESSNASYGVYTFDVNAALIIEKNANQYLVIDDDGIKVTVPIKSANLQITQNCNLLLDQHNHVLTRKCMLGSSSISEEYWLKEKVDAYLGKPKHEIAYDQYVNSIISNLFQNTHRVPVLDDLQLSEGDKKELDESILSMNGFYPIMAFGDFNGDNKLPDIAVIIKNTRIDDIFRVNASKLLVIHAGNSMPFEIKQYLCSWIEKESSRVLESHWEDKIVKKNSDGILNVCLGKSAVVHYWNGYTYKQYWVSD